MNIRTNDAGAVSESHIKSRGFSVYKIIEGSDMEQSSFSLPQFTNGELTIKGGYWNYSIYKDGKSVFDGWWNTNEEFDETLREISAKKD